ncbi:2-methylcitrate dehydratase PrpD [Desulfotomaculum arcticum]|uniref:2-methylcitrate dehydratase PrpD n=1 Tax=Desulfotruncus arcticus DSM 17038 TaxID=1121424 RepID=A0A1I2PF26_9FIRM|nr:MmgE/PrpD family protein [Desulfotruncus arcticus]SFG14745.1 2-methylcitrate dehydratase PrpD [Desulfotomaculum arcticum] [Desulfotruncus arcticus DSM 17038]
MNKQTIAQILGDFINKVQYEDIDSPTVWRAKMCILDMAGVIIAAQAEESTQILLRYLQRHGDNPESSVLGTAFRLPAAHAAMLNSTMAHSLELEDHHSHKRSLNHPGVCTTPPALAIAEKLGSSGRDFLTAVVLGYEIGSRISAATRLGVLNLEQGFHESSVCGPFSAATAAGKLTGITADRLAQAFGICGSLAAGSMEFKSSEAWSKRLQVGSASRSGVMAVELADAGFTGPPTVFEGKHGFFHSYVHEGNYDLSRVTKDLGTSWDINNIQYKPFACAGVLHSAVTAAQKAGRLHHLHPDEIQRVLVRTASKVVEEYAQPHERKAAPENPVGAQFSLQYSVAVMLVRGKALLEEFSPEAIRDPDILRVAALVTPLADSGIDAGWPGIDPTEMTIILKDGREILTRVEEAKGDLVNPVTDDELLDKFRELTAPYLSAEAIENALEMFQKLETVKDMRELTGVLTPLSR